jgi:hypothetical protein
LRVRPSSAPAQEGADIELIIGKRRVVVRPGFDEQRLRRVLSVLEDANVFRQAALGILTPAATK